MVNIIRNEGSTIYYSCDCGTNGCCMIRPFDSGKTIVVDVECPNCYQVERVTLLQQDSEESRDDVLENINEVDFTWSVVVGNKIIN